MARNKDRLIKRNAAVRAHYKSLYEKNKVERKYTMEYLINQTADKFFIEPRTVYSIIRTPEEVKKQLSLFGKEENSEDPATWHNNHEYTTS